MTSYGHFQDSTFGTKSDNSLCSSDHCTPQSDTLLEYDGSVPFEGPDDPPPDSDEPPFMDLFTESESSKDTENTVCDCLLPIAHLTNDLGFISCNSTYMVKPQQLNTNTLSSTVQNVRSQRNS